MIKLLLKLAVVALVANAAWHVMVTYSSYYKFKDAVQQTTQFGNDKTIEVLRGRVMQLANDYDVPLSDENLKIRREDLHTITDIAYVQPIDLLPWYQRQWPFTAHIDTSSDAPMVRETPR